MFYHLFELSNSLHNKSGLKLRNIKLIIEYDGAEFEGWQTQPSGRSVQDRLEKAASQVLGERIKIIGAGRTDAGVHARGQVANFFTDNNMDGYRLRYAINSVLPPAIAIKQAAEAKRDFDSRRDAKLRTYAYYIWNDKYPSPFFRPYSWWISRPLELPVMREAALFLLGEHDFAAFTPEKIKSTVRNLATLEIEERSDYPGKMISIIIAADSFLYHLVRVITGTLVEVGLGNIPPERVAEVLASKDIRKAGPKAPAKGLFLERVDY